MWITLTKGPIFGENKYKSTFFHMSDFLKHFVGFFQPIIVIVTSRNIIFFVLMKKKTLSVSCNISHFLCPNPSQPSQKK